MEGNKNTWNVFKDKVKDLNDAEKQELLTEIQLSLMKERTELEKSGTEVSDHRRLYRKQIAYLKTVMHVKGFHYHARGE